MVSLKHIRSLALLWFGLAAANTDVSVAAAPPSDAVAPADTLRLADALAAAREANPRLHAARFLAAAAKERTGRVGALPDPVLSFGLMNRPLDDFGIDEPMTMNTIELMQRFPWPGVLGNSEERSQHLAEATRFDALEAEHALMARVKSVYYRLAFIDRALAIMEETRGLLRDLHQVTSSMYSVGSALQQDVLQAEVAVAQMSEDITVLTQERLAAAARLNALMGRGATVPVGATELSGIGAELPTVESLMDLAVEGRPALQAVQQRSLAAAAGYRAARRENYPDVAVRLAYNQRPHFTDMMTLMVGVSLPLWGGSRSVPLTSEADALRSMEEARALEAYNDTFALLAELRAQAERARHLARLYTTSILPQARASVESSLSAYRVGRVDYMTVLANQMIVNRYEIETVRLAAEFHRAVAEIDALVGGAAGGTQ